MNQPKFNFLLAAFFAVCLFSLNNALAQTTVPKRQSEQSFDVVLQTVVASNNPADKSGTQPIAAVVKKLKSDFSFSDYRLTSTFMQRVSNNGNVELKSVAYEEKQDKNFPVFSEWEVNGLQNLADENGQETIQIQRFRFGQRIPILNSSGTMGYESIGLSNRFSLQKNTPTVVGSITTAKPDELMFLILTVKQTEK